MPFQVNTEIDLTPDTQSKYLISAQHRMVGHPIKSIWTISYDEEVRCFLNSRVSNWFAPTHYWGLHVIGSQINVLGYNNLREELKIAKFVGSSSDVWHGYPADYLHKKHDIPHTNVLTIWRGLGYIGKSTLNKLRRGIPCNL
ncbi:hypothetical protein SAMN05428949_1984 [Chitinophaga sp. YR627]|nr:hypothetical protein SAMN05428949_1984 [Chitinophaga sp. YR627]